ncbi:MAG: DUF2066 domain-containing protein [Pseudomonadota bacterium]|nr:DUF2066 domain-containing protein [Pseudomonadota bacterium]
MRLIHLFVLALALAFASSVQAASVVVPDLYRASTYTDGRGEAARAAGLRQAFAKVLVKATGSDAVLTAPQTELLLERAPDLVTIYRFEPVAAPQSDSAEAPAEVAPSAVYRFTAEFEPRTVQLLLRDAGLAPWPARRPLTLVWLTLDRGTIVSGEQRGEVQAFVEEAQRLGLPVVFPSMDLTDQQAIQPADIQGFFPEQILQASRRYDPATVLVGRLAREGSLWTARWALLERDATAVRWQDSDPALAVLLTQGAQALGSQLLAQYGIGGGEAAASQFVELAVSGLRSLNDYGRVLNFLAGLPPVSTVTISHVRADAVVYQLQTKATRDQLRQSIDLGRVLVPADVEASGSVLGPMAPLAYRLNR